ncbi:hypothetical protein SAMN05444392_101692 [Seinonella peptonophila]|uniref:Uncharacterized protein n=1 Tax=Seinonella peptonophila TaxID=112248 RepID=A0A1M4TXM3_9BACL|nr:hypothetical protein SAMN05444392_101692 [Seinonella peptonophila]
MFFNSELIGELTKVLEKFHGVYLLIHFYESEIDVERLPALKKHRIHISDLQQGVSEDIIYKVIA